MTEKPQLYVERRQPGDLGAVFTGGPVGRTIRILQLLNGDGFRDYEHVRVYLGGGWVLQAEAGGATISRNQVVKGEVWSTGLFPEWAPVTATECMALARAKFEGVPYGWLDYLALTEHRLHVPDLRVWPGYDEHGQPERTGLKEFIGQTRTQICSQLGDNFELALGRHLFADGRWPGDVTPGATANLFIARALEDGRAILGRDYW
jgi:hypothetical protein